MVWGRNAINQMAGGNTFFVNFTENNLVDVCTKCEDENMKE